ncbi:armadillo repeat-containing protein 8-like [Zingiber officinale]|uniref:armadillo repeat-containing protein 8-like n=1 Tax=Zingiber officinale TaxID=94328 RepID=UPI001C4D4E0A|nr:armadillo repeat-containing protein 8-like [Zingiber officinale]
MPSSAVTNRPEEVTARLGVGGGAAQGEALLKALREVKNQIIGNKTKKLLYLQLGAVPKIVSVLAASVASSLGGAGLEDAPVIVQAAAAIGSFACGVEDGVRAVLDAGAVPHLISILSHHDDKVVDAGARSLKMIFQSKMAPKYDVLQDKNLNFILSLLDSDNENVTELAACIIAHSCETNEEQKALCDAGVLQRLVSLLGGSSNQKDACLECIKAVVKDNSEVSSRFSCIGNGKALKALSDLIQDRYPYTRLLSCKCLIAIGHASPSYVEELQIKTKLVLVLAELLEEPGRVGDEAPFSLKKLIADNEELHKQALSINVIEKLCNFLHMSSIQSRRLQGILLALSELCSKLEKCRCQLLSPQVLDLVIDSLEHDCAEVRAAACICIRNITRSLKNLSAGSLSNEAVVIRLVQLLYDPSSSIQLVALGALCNIIVICASRKSVLIRCGGVSQLVRLSTSMDSTLRLKSLSVLRNFLFLANTTDKECILKELSLHTLVSLLNDAEHSIQEQALALVNNLIDGCSSVEHIFTEKCYSLILDAVTRQLKQASSLGVCIQGMFVLSNIAAWSDFDKDSVTDYLIAYDDNHKPSLAIKFLQSNDKSLRLASLWCLLNLTNPSSAGSSRRVTKLQTAGIIFQLKSMLNDPCSDCKLRLRMVLEQCTEFETSQP